MNYNLDILKSTYNSHKNSKKILFNSLELYKKIN